jgi:uncharacterized cysteine cluster protein YcgN (CxxCxxCC family)
MDDRAYIETQDKAAAEYESLCRRCGTCCGAQGGDPCANLKEDAAGNYRCVNYGVRLGVQKTVSGRQFTCVPIRDVLKFGIPYDGCGYRR